MDTNDNLIVDVQGFNKNKQSIPKNLIKENTIMEELEKPGVYFLFNKTDLVYVGQADNLRKRLVQHTRHSNWLHDKWDNFSFIITNSQTTAETIESIILILLQNMKLLKYNNRTEMSRLPTNNDLKEGISVLSKIYNNKNINNMKNKQKIETATMKNAKSHNISSYIDIEKFSSEIQELYKTISDKILSLNPKITKENNKQYVSYKINKKNFIDISPIYNKINVFFNFDYGELDDKYKIARNVSEIGHWGNGDYEVSIKPEEEEKLNHLFEFIDQAYQKFKEIHQF